MYIVYRRQSDLFLTTILLVTRRDICGNCNITYRLETHIFAEFWSEDWKREEGDGGVWGDKNIGDSKEA